MENNINRIIELHHNKSDDSFKELSSLINGKNGTYIKKLNKRFSFLNIKINGSTGKGGRSKVPWICFFDDKKDTAQYGLYTVILFDQDKDRIIIANEEGFKWYKDRYPNKKIRDKAISRRRLIFTDDLKHIFNTDIHNLYIGDSTLAKGYVRCTITFKILNRIINENYLFKIIEQMIENSRIIREKNPLDTNYRVKSKLSIKDALINIGDNRDSEEKTVSSKYRAKILKEENIINQIEKLKISDKNDKKRLVRQRSSQGLFRDMLFINYKKCELTIFKNSNILIASHIKPYSVCEPNEKYDPNNGILLNALLDKAFDCGLITFDNESGLTKYSHELSKDEINVIKEIINGKKLIITPERGKYLKYHLNKIFRYDANNNC